jgi:two-component system, OmpR family, manganese sensing sensor histidine kinase
MFQTTRRRLALWYTTVTAVLLLLFASGFYLYVRSTLIERIDDTLNHVVEVVQRSLVIEPINPHSEGGDLRVKVEASFRDNASTNEDDHIDLEWFNSIGELQWSTLNEPLNIPLHSNTTGETVQVPGSELLLRQVTQRVQIGRQVLGYLRVSHPWFEVTKPSRQLIFDLSLWIVFIVASVGAIGWFLSGLAMEPVRESYQRLKQFTADASHELRSPIAAIQTNVQVALADPDPDPQIQQQHLQVVERLTRRLGRLVDDLLFLARQDSGIVQPRFAAVFLPPLLQEVVEEQTAIAAEKGITLSVEIEAFNAQYQELGESNFTNETFTNHNKNHDLSSLQTTDANLQVHVTVAQAQPASSPTYPNFSSTENYILNGDRDQLTRLFTNLVNNAVQYTPSGGKVHIELEKVVRANFAYIQVKVSDTGIGIPAEAIPQIFDRFYRVDPSRTHASQSSLTTRPAKSVTGSGLGLAIAQAIVENHQGQIRLNSELGKGTTVTVTLPQLKPEGL